MGHRFVSLRLIIALDNRHRDRHRDQLQTVCPIEPKQLLRLRVGLGHSWGLFAVVYNVDLNSMRNVMVPAAADATAVAAVIVVVVVSV